jgi:hypothetical protein
MVVWVVVVVVAEERESGSERAPALKAVGGVAEVAESESRVSTHHSSNPAPKVTDKHRLW